MHETSKWLNDEINLFPVKSSTVKVLDKRTKITKIVVARYKVLMLQRD